MCFEATFWSEKKNTRAKQLFTEYQKKHTRQTSSGCKKTLGKQALYRVKKETLGKQALYRVKKRNTRQTSKFVKCKK